MLKVSNYKNIEKQIDKFVQKESKVSIARTV